MRPLGEGTTVDGSSQLSRLLVPGRADEAVDSVLVLTRAASIPWSDWEIEMLAEFGPLIPMVRNRIDLERRIAASFDAAPIGITLRSADLELVECNRAFCEFVGFQRASDLVGHHWMDFVAIDEADGETVAALAMPPDAGHGQLEVPFRHRTGSVVWGRVAESQIVTQHGERWMSYVEDITELRRKQEIVKLRATKDALTGLANRHDLIDVLAEHLNSAPHADGRAPCAAVLLDLNGFKIVNDTYGHAAGDAVLVAVSQRLRDAVRQSDLVARYGGDEFVVVLAGPIGIDDAARLAGELADVVASPVTHEGVDLEVGAAVGMALGLCSEDVDDVIARADAQMYAAKTARPSGRSSFVSVG